MLLRKKGKYGSCSRSSCICCILTFFVSQLLCCHGVTPLRHARLVPVPPRPRPSSSSSPSLLVPVPPCPRLSAQLFRCTKRGTRLSCLSYDLCTVCANRDCAGFHSCPSSWNATDFFGGLPLPGLGLELLFSALACVIPATRQGQGSAWSEW